MSSRPAPERNLFSEDQIARANANIVDLIGRDVALKRAGGELVGLCPFHSEKTPSFYVIPAKGFYHCFGCGSHGNAIAYLMRTRSLDFPSAMRELLREASSEIRPLARQAAPIREDKPDQMVLELWRSATEPRLVEHYLISRGLSVGRFRSLRGHGAVWCAESKKPRPAVLAAVVDSSDRLCGLQRIWIERTVVSVAGAFPSKGARSTDLDVGKKTLGRLSDGAVRLFPPARSMGIAEGPETALAAAEIFCMPVWASCGGARMGRLWMPPECRSVTIFGDNGTNGRELAERAAEAHRARGLKGSVEYPAEQWGDWNDAIRAQQAVE